MDENTTNPPEQTLNEQSLNQQTPDNSTPSIGVEQKSEAPIEDEPPKLQSEIDMKNHHVETSKLVNKNPIQLSWKDLEYTVSLSRPSLKILNGVTCGTVKKFKPVMKKILSPQTAYVNPGQVLAIMGPSGSGKTSLLNILAMRVQNTSGNILVNGSPVTKKFKSVSAYVQQDDILNGNLTVFECLFFTALLRLPSQYSYAEKRQICHDIIDELGLRHCMQTKIGIPGVSKGISGGERKRVSIAVEMLTSPSVLFLDEPTSGLDSKTALSIMTTIIKLAKNQNRTVVCTIHQPRSDIFSLFDKLLLLSGGKVAYFGDAQESVNYFDKLGYPMPEEYNPADHLIDLITKTANDSKDFQEQIKIEEKRIATLIEGHQKQGVDIPPIDSQFILENRKIQKYNQYVWWEFLILIVRFTLANLRDRMYTVVRSFQALSMAILVGLIYLQVKNNQKSIQDRMGAIFFILINQTMNSLYGAVTMFQAEKVVFLRERAAKTYRVGSYYLAKVLAEVIMVIILPTIFTVIAYWMVGFKQEAGPFFFFLFIIILVNLVAQGLGIAISTLMPSIQVAMALSPILTTVLMIFGGFYLNASTVPPYFIWIYYISFFRYGFEALIVNEFTGRTFVCLDSELITSNGITICPITTGEQVIQNYSMENVNIWLDVAMLCGLIIITRIWGYIFIRFVQRPKISR